MSETFKKPENEEIGQGHDAGEPEKDEEAPDHESESGDGSQDDTASTSASAVNDSSESLTPESDDVAESESDLVTENHEHTEDCDTDGDGEPDCDQPVARWRCSCHGNRDAIVTAPDIESAKAAYKVEMGILSTPHDIIVGPAE